MSLEGCYSANHTGYAVSQDQCGGRGQLQITEQRREADGPRPVKPQLPCIMRCGGIRVADACWEWTQKPQNCRDAETAGLTGVRPP